MIFQVLQNWNNTHCTNTCVIILNRYLSAQTGEFMVCYKLFFKVAGFSNIFRVAGYLWLDDKVAMEGRVLANLLN